jgi:hypothetical protein
MDNFQKHNNCVNISPSQTFRSYLRYQYGHGIYPTFRKFERIKIHLDKTSNHLIFLRSGDRD